MEIIRKAVAAEFQADDAGIIEAVVSVFNLVDHGGDVIVPGAFQASLQTKLPNFVWSHNWDQPLGRTLEAADVPPGDPRLPEAIRDRGGLWVKGQFNLDTQRGREAYSDIRFGSITEFSIGFSVVESEREGEIRRITKADLYEWSPVLVGMNPATTLISVKGEPRAGCTLDDQAQDVLAAAESLIVRLQGYAQLRQRDQRRLSAKRLSQARQLIDQLQAFVVLGESMQPVDLRRELLRYQMWRQQL
jgi:HK97 family phage prohead protease